MREIVLQMESLADVPDIAGRIIRESGAYRVLAFYGEMGAGKTTLIQAVCHNLGVRTEVTSPTFALVNEYSAAGGPVYHLDFYRIAKVSEALDFGIDEYFDSGNWCLMEWPEKVDELLPRPIIRLYLEVGPGERRKITMRMPD